MGAVTDTRLRRARRHADVGGRSIRHVRRGDLIVDLLTERFPVTVDAVIVVSTADACDLVTGEHVVRIRVAYGLTADQRASVIRRRSTPDTPTAVGPATGAFPDALDAALRSRR